MTTDAALAPAEPAPAPCCQALIVRALPGVVLTCGECGSVWRPEGQRYVAPANEESHDPVGDLAALARWLPAIVGRAASLGEGGGGARRLGDRPDSVDEHHRDKGTGMRRGMRALTLLDALERDGQQRHVKILWFAYVLTGPEAIRAHKGGLEDLVARQFGRADQIAYWEAHKNHSVRRHQVRTYGEGLLKGALAAYEGAARGRLGRRPEGVAEQHMVLSAKLEALIDKTLAGLKPKSEVAASKSEVDG